MENNTPQEAIYRKKRGRPKKGIVSPEISELSQRSNASWTNSMEEHLLNLRLILNKDSFLNSKDKIAIGRVWRKILLDFNTKFHTEFSIEQLKNKFNSLKSIYKTVSNSFEQTGNSPAPKLPDNWDSLNQYFQGRQGLSGQTFGEAEDIQEEVEYFDGSGDCSEDSFRPSTSQTQSSNQSSRKKPGNNLGDAIIEMGSLLSSGMHAMAERQPTESNLVLGEALKSIQRSLDQNSLVNLEILKVLQSLKDKNKD
jgi:hypothetical protein